MLKELIISRILAEGPIPIDEYIKLCLTHPVYGYYTRKPTIFGAEGDFVTSPEISSIFGELIGAFFASLYRTLGSPNEFILCEGGPGTGKSMKDVIHGMAGFIDLKIKGNFVCIEISERLQKQQKEMFKETGLDENRLIHVKSLHELKQFQKPILFYANEWLDALPPKQYQKINGKFYRTATGLDAEHELVYTVIPEPVTLTNPIYGLPNPHDIPDGAIIEINDQAESIILDIAHHLQTYGGVALIIDYGYQQTPYVSTLQAVQGHQRIDPLKQPGTSDLTTLINFNALSALPLPSRVHCSPVMTQRDFLYACGIEQRIHSEIARHPHRAEQLNGVLKKLTSEKEMGTLFKAFFLTAPITHKKGDEDHPLFIRT